MFLPSEARNERHVVVEPSTAHSTRFSVIFNRE
jgi:hypothetical protein